MHSVWTSTGVFSMTRCASAKLCRGLWKRMGDRSGSVHSSVLAVDLAVSTVCGILGRRENIDIIMPFTVSYRKFGAFDMDSVRFCNWMWDKWQGNHDVAGYHRQRCKVLEAPGHCKVLTAASAHAGARLPTWSSIAGPNSRVLRMQEHACQPDLQLRRDRLCRFGRRAHGGRPGCRLRLLDPGPAHWPLQRRRHGVLRDLEDCRVYEP